MQDFKNQLLELTKDQTHGSSFILEKIIKLFFHFQPSAPEIDWGLQTIRSIDPAMKLIHHFIETLQKEKEDFQGALASYVEQWANLEQEMVQKLLVALPKARYRILTHSHSNTIIKVLEMLSQKKKIEVIQTTSNPGGEGKIQAEQLSKLRLQVRLVDDELIGQAVSQVDAVLLGVDQYDDVRFVNKVGSKHIVNTSVQNGIRVYVLADPRKRINKVGRTKGSFETIPLGDNVTIVSP